MHEKKYVNTNILKHLSLDKLCVIRELGSSNECIFFLVSFRISKLRYKFVSIFPDVKYNFGSYCIFTSISVSLLIHTIDSNFKSKTIFRKSLNR